MNMNSHLHAERRSTRGNTVWAEGGRNSQTLRHRRKSKPVESVDKKLCHSSYQGYLLVWTTFVFASVFMLSPICILHLRHCNALQLVHSGHSFEHTNRNSPWRWCEGASLRCYEQHPNGTCSQTQKSFPAKKQTGQWTGKSLIVNFFDFM